MAARHGNKSGVLVELKGLNKLLAIVSKCLGQISDRWLALST